MNNSSTPTTHREEELPIRSGWFRTRYYTCDTFEEALLTLLPSNALSVVGIMAACNLGSLFFHLYATAWWLLRNDANCCWGGDGGEAAQPLLWWLLSTVTGGPGGTLGLQARIIWMWLMAQLLVGSCKLLFRFNTKRRCMILAMANHFGREEQQPSPEGLANFIESVSFRVHAGLGRASQVLNWTGHVLYFLLGIDRMVLRDEKVSLFRLFYLRRIGALEEVVDHNYYLSGAVLLDVCCTNICIGTCRGILNLYVLSSHAFHDQMERRTRSSKKKAHTRLTVAEINQILKQDTFSSTTDPNPSCSICLETFGDGEDVAMLPCDDRHTFHFSCIQTWLSKQDTCPLCQESLSRYCE